MPCDAHNMTSPRLRGRLRASFGSPPWSRFNPTIV
jgi:hypothetical protein